MNPNNCTTCDYSKMGSTGGWCYMWRSEPTTVCYQHTGRRADRIAKLIADAEKEATDISKENTDGNQD